MASGSDYRGERCRMMEWTRANRRLWSTSDQAGGHWLLPLGQGQPTKLPTSRGASQSPGARGRPGGGGPAQEGSSGGAAGTQQQEGTREGKKYCPDKQRHRPGETGDSGTGSNRSMRTQRWSQGRGDPESQRWRDT